MPETLEAPPVVNPVLPASFTPPAPEAPAAPPSPEVVEKEREAGLDNLFARKREDDAAPPEKKVEPPKEEARPAPEVKTVEQPKVVDGPKVEPGREAPKTDDAKLPESLTEGVPETQPGNHREAARAFNLMRKRLAQADSERKAHAEELKKAREAVVAPPDYEETKGRAERLETERQQLQDQLNERSDRLYAADLRQRPEYKQYVDEPTAGLKQFGTDLLKEYGLKYRDFTDAMEMAPAERKAVLNEHMEGMSAIDRGEYQKLMQSYEAVEQNRAILERNAKTKAEEFKAADEAKANQKKDGDVRAMVAAQTSWREKRAAALPSVFKPEGDEPETVTYRKGLQDIEERALAIVRAGGIGSLKPEFQAMMVYDAMTADYTMRHHGATLQNKEARIKELETQATEREAAFKTLESELAEYRGGVPGGEEGSVTGSDGVAGDAPLEARLDRFPKLWAR